MRISGGDARGIRLKVPPNIRPAAEKVRQAIFASLAASVVEARVLDLFCGSGAYGLEALSRGADDAVFVDRDATCVRTARENAVAAGLDEMARFRRRDVPSYVRSSAAKDGPFDLVFLDPPYAEVADVVPKVLLGLDGAVAETARAVVEAPKAYRPPEASDGWMLEADRRYGDTRILVFARQSAGAGVGR